MGRKQLLVDAGLVPVAVEMGARDELDEVAVADLILCEQDQVVGVGVGLPLTTLVAAGGHVGLDADDRLDPCGGRRLVELNCSVQRAVVGEGQCRHARLCGLARHLSHP